MIGFISAIITIIQAIFSVIKSVFIFIFKNNDDEKFNHIFEKVQNDLWCGKWERIINKEKGCFYYPYFKDLLKLTGIRKSEEFCKKCKARGLIIYEGTIPTNNTKIKISDKEGFINEIINTRKS